MLGCGERDPPPPFSSRNSGFAASAARKDVRESPEAFFLLAARALFSPPPPQPTVTVSGRRYKLAKKRGGEERPQPRRNALSRKGGKRNLGNAKIAAFFPPSTKVRIHRYSGRFSGATADSEKANRAFMVHFFFASRYLERYSGFLVNFFPGR